MSRRFCFAERDFNALNVLGIEDLFGNVIISNGVFNFFITEYLYDSVSVFFDGG